jgi:hypothetical protein
MLTKPLTLVASMILFTAIAGQASARPQHSGTEHSVHAVTFPDNVQAPEFMPDTGTPSPQIAVHRYTGGPKSND